MGRRKNRILGKWNKNKVITIDFTTKPEFTPEYITDQNGTQRLYDQNHKLHSYNDLPAAIYKNGDKYWLKHGKQHRDNGLPAVVFENGLKSYWINGKNNDPNRFHK